MLKLSFLRNCILKKAYEQKETKNLKKLNKICSDLGFCSSKEANFYIAAGLVRVDGKVVRNATDLFDETQQKIILDDRALRCQEQKKTLILHKPHYYQIVGNSLKNKLHARNLLVFENQIDNFGYGVNNQNSLRNFYAAEREVDEISGLFVFSQDGRISRLLNEKESKIYKTYIVNVKGKICENKIKMLEETFLDGEEIKYAKIKQKDENSLLFQLRQYKYKQISRMCELVGLKAVSIHKTQIGLIKLGSLPLGKWRFLKSYETF